MANSAIYFYPGGSTYGGLNKIDFGERVSDLQITPYREVSDGVSMGGRFSRVARRSGMRVRIVLERFTDYRLAEQLYSLQSHVEAGRGFSFAVDDDKKFAAFVNLSSASSGFSYSHNTFNHEDRLLSEYGTPHGMVADDVLHMESFGPGGRREELQLQSYTLADKKIVTKTPAIYNHPLPSLVRHRDFFPYLIWPQGQMNSPIITHDHRVSWTLDITAEGYTGNLLASYGQAGPDGSNMSNDSQLRQDGTSLDQLYGGDHDHGKLYGDTADLYSDAEDFGLSLGGSSPIDKVSDMLSKGS